jgi:hypothetical protein
MEKFRTVIDIPASPDKISYQSRGLFMGSCFADDIGERMQRLKFPVLINPFGTLFNPASISANLMTLISGELFTESDLYFHDGMWFSFSHYTGFAHPDRHECLDLINRALTGAASWLQQCSFLVITFGTAWTYTYKETGKLVANCHKLPAACFSRDLLDPDRIGDMYGSLFGALRRINPAMRVIFTVSPVRHWKDGAVNNQVSKSVLLLSIHELLKKHDNIVYFPAYEIFMDELRDYRFYAGDMFHPSEQGVAYVWERFCDTFLHGDSRKIMAGVTAIINAVAHRPRQTDSPNQIKFTQNILKQIDQFTLSNPYLDFSRETAILRERL